MYEEKTISYKRGYLLASESMDDSTFPKNQHIEKIGTNPRVQV